MIGGIVGGVVAIAAALLAFFLLKRNKNRDVPDDFDGVEPVESTGADSTFDGDDAIFVSEYGLSDHANQSVEDCE
jgi:hypothetical protein